MLSISLVCFVLQWLKIAIFQNLRQFTKKTYLFNYNITENLWWKYFNKEWRKKLIEQINNIFMEQTNTASLFDTKSIDYLHFRDI